MLLKASQFAKQITEITEEDINLIMQARKTLLFNEDVAWEKREGNEYFDIPMGYFDVAEVCKLVGSFILEQLSQFSKHHSVWLYRDDGLAILKGLSGPETERVEKKVRKVFKDRGIKIKIN